MIQTLLFDIDGTLLLTRGASRRALALAFKELFGAWPELGDIRTHGKTDPAIIAEIAESILRRPLDATEFDSLCSSYIKQFETTIAETTEFSLLPGVAELLEELDAAGKYNLGLQTGNLEKAAWMKLARGRIQGYFAFGGFGCDSSDREHIVRASLSRASELYGKEATAPECVLLIGDAAQDIAAGQAAGVKTMAVLTGLGDKVELLEAGPDYVLKDLREIGQFMAILTGGGS